MGHANCVDAGCRPPYNAPPSRRGDPLTNYDFALARRQALQLVACQAAIAVIVALLVALMRGVAAGAAVLVGGGIGGAATIVQVAASFRRGAQGDAHAIARGFYRGEALKIAVTVLLFVIALRHHQVPPGLMFAGYAATFVAYWVALVRSAP